MKKLSLSLLSVSIMAMIPVIAGAAGTYYNTGLYQNPQRFNTSGGGYYNNYGSNRGYGKQVVQNTVIQKYTKQKSKQDEKTNTSKQGFRLGANLSHEFANWDFEMTNAGSKLRYDNLAWNVINGEAAYYFGSSVPMQIKVGARYGMQSGETTMTDDDISSGAYGYEDYEIGRVSGYAMSIGTSKGGTQMGFNAALGFTDLFSVGRVKMTPSLGYRYFKYKLTTEKNSGLTMDVFDGNSSHPYYNCIDVSGEIQCDPYVAFVDTSGNLWATGRAVNEDGSLTEYIVAPEGKTIAGVSLGDSYYYSQSGTSHKYETEWAGPYVALDMEYTINNDNFVNAGIELGLPVYNSKGDQPYRVDWAHPTSVEDKGGFGDAYHLGLSALWSTAVTDSTMFTLGMTYDYYKVKNADATTYINSSYFNNIVTDVQNAIDYLNTHGGSAEQIAAYEYLLANAQADVDYYSARGWKLESKDEIKSVYSSMGIRMGISVKF